MIFFGTQTKENILASSKKIFPNTLWCHPSVQTFLGYHPYKMYWIDWWRVRILEKVMLSSILRLNISQNTIFSKYPKQLRPMSSFSKVTRQQCSFSLTGRNMNDYYSFKMGFNGLAEFPTISQENIDQTLENRTTICLDDICVFKRCSKKNYKEKLSRILKKMEEAGHRESKRKLAFLKATWLGH